MRGVKLRHLYNLAWSAPGIPESFHCLFNAENLRADQQGMDKKCGNHNKPGSFIFCLRANQELVKGAGERPEKTRSVIKLTAVKQGKVENRKMMGGAKLPPPPGL